MKLLDAVTKFDPEAIVYDKVKREYLILQIPEGWGGACVGRDRSTFSVAEFLALRHRIFQYDLPTILRTLRAKTHIIHGFVRTRTAARSTGSANSSSEKCGALLESMHRGKLVGLSQCYQTKPRRTDLDPSCADMPIAAMLTCGNHRC